ncbi:acyl carrier protein [bacterium]|nr:acyl carrier protein [bacterium]
MNRDEIQIKVMQLVKEKLCAKKNVVLTESTLLQDDLNADSLDVADLINEFEETFEISIPDDVMDNIKTIKDIVDFVDREKNHK